jgi:hypothetical protein
MSGSKSALIYIYIYYLGLNYDTYRAILLWPIAITLSRNHIWFSFKKLVLLSSLAVFLKRTHINFKKKHIKVVQRSRSRRVSWYTYIVSNVLRDY